MATSRTTRAASQVTNQANELHDEIRRRNTKQKSSVEKQWSLQNLGVHMWTGRYNSGASIKESTTGALLANSKQTVDPKMAANRDAHTPQQHF